MIASINPSPAFLPAMGIGLATVIGLLGFQAPSKYDADSDRAVEERNESNFLRHSYASILDYQTPHPLPDLS